MYLHTVAVVTLLFTLMSMGEAKPLFRKPPPPGVLESTTTGLCTVVELRDGSILANTGALSTDGGRTWGPSRSFGEGISGDGILRLKSGALCLSADGRLWLSRDEGQTWEGPRTARLVGSPLSCALVQLSSGRLLWPSRACFGNLWHRGLAYEDASAYGTWQGLRVQLEGHGHIPEVSIGSVSRSDDEGASWCAGQPARDWGESTNLCYSSAVLMGWFGPDGKPTRGAGWVTDCDEPTVAECSDGRVLFFARSTVGRIVQSISEDGGETWTPVEPTDLAASYSPNRLVRIPKTGDLLCVWNQMSGDEIRRGYRRGRLSVAVSQDSGRTWGHFKTLELSEGLEDIARVQPEHPLPMVVRAEKDCGELPPGWMTADYPCVSFAGDSVFIAYERAWIEKQAAGGAATLGERNPQTNTATKTSERVLRVYPLAWFYE